jgi:L-glyceraldehyde 3-phosphate reductase
MGISCIIHQPKYSLLDRWVENGLTAVLKKEGMGCIAFSPLAQGLLSDKYLNNIPKGSRADKPHGYLQSNQITSELRKKLNQLNDIAQKRNQTLAQMAIAWLLKDDSVTSVLVGVSSADQLKSNKEALQNTAFSKEDLTKIDEVLRS